MTKNFLQKTPTRKPNLWARGLCNEDLPALRARLEANGWKVKATKHGLECTSRGRVTGDR